jgi:hypothetical protein
MPGINPLSLVTWFCNICWVLFANHLLEIFAPVLKKGHQSEVEESVFVWLWFRVNADLKVIGGMCPLFHVLEFG